MESMLAVLLMGLFVAGIGFWTIWDMKRDKKRSDDQSK